MLKVVIDTNQFVSSLISKKGKPAQLVDLWRQQHFILVTSPEIIAEIKKVLEYPHIRKKYNLKKEDIQSLLILIEHEAVIVPNLPAVDVIKDDPDDNKFLACALAAQTEYIVTGDQHLLSLGKYGSTLIVTVKDFLIYIDNSTLKQIEIAAGKEHDSISKWVKKRLVSSLKTAWPKDYFDLFGALKDDSFKRPVEMKFSKDRKRQIL